MTESYYTEDQKLCKLNTPKWSFDECMLIQDILIDKGYLVNCVSRRGCDRKYHDAWHVKRADVPRLIEQLFRQRFTVEVQAEGHNNASINFCYDYHAETVISAVKRFQKNKNKETMV